MVLGSFADLSVHDVEKSVAFYRSLLQLEVLVDHGWYAELGVDGRTLIAFVQSGHETVPAITATPPRGVLVSFEVESADAVYARVAALRCDVLVDLCNELGQRHFMVTDPDGAVIDVIERDASGAPLRRTRPARSRHHRCAHRIPDVWRGATCARNADRTAQGGWPFAGEDQMRPR